jgi:predicted small secreted protein
MIKKAALTILIILSLAAFLGCNTVHGMGKDIEGAGQAIEKASGKKIKAD